MRQRKITVIIGVTVLAIGFATWLAGPAVAQDATPVTGRVAPPPTECTIEPRSLESLQALAEAAEAIEEPPDEGPLATIPEGDPADDATIAGITATLREVYACFNGGQFLRVYSLYSDDYLRGRFAAEPPPPFISDFYDLLATPQPRPEDDLAEIVAIRAPRLLPDDRAGAIADLAIPGAGEEVTTLFIIFVKQDDRWLINSSLPLAEDAESDAATPAA